MLNPASQFAEWSDPQHPEEPGFLTERVNTFYRRTVNDVTGGHLLKGRVPGSGDILFVSNDYLSLADHPDILRAQVESLTREGHGILRSALYQFSDSPLKRLESAMAAHMGAEDALLCQSGWCANTGLIEAIADASTPVYVDMFAHMSIWEGVNSAGAVPRPFRHNSAQSLERLIQKHGAGIVAVDSVYSTNGDVCPLEEVVAIAQRYGCILIVDESHSLGIFGSKGEGMVSALGLADKVHFRTSSLSKSFAARGGIIAGSARHIEYLHYHSRPACFSSGLLPYEIAGLRATLRVIREEHYRREKVLANAYYLKGRLTELGYDVGREHSQIIALVAGAEHRTIRLRDALESRGVFGSPFCDPATPRNRSLIRFTINAAHSHEELERVAEVCAEISADVSITDWPRAKAASGRAAYN